MKKYLSSILAFLLLAPFSFLGGVLVAEKKLSIENKGKKINIVLPEKEGVILGDSTEIFETYKEKNEAGESDAEKSLPENDITVENKPMSETAKEIDLSFALIGDSQYFESEKNSGYRLAATYIKKINPNFVFGMGDLASNCEEKSECKSGFIAWKNVLGSLSSKAYATQGNHDRAGKEKSDSAWEEAFSYFPTNGPGGFSRFTYSFDFKNSHFVVLDSEKPKENNINETQLDWLEKDLSRNNKENTFVFFHAPAYPTSSKIGECLDENPGERNKLWNILVKYKVKAVFSGHEHIQSRKNINGIYQFIFGNTDVFNHEAPKSGMAEYAYVGQGFGIVEVNGKKVTVKTYTVQGKLVNSFTF